MSESLVIHGGSPLQGTVEIAGAKNAALPMLMATLLTSEAVEFERIPELEDTTLALSLLEHFGADVTRNGSRVRIQVPRLVATEASYSLVKALRASFWVLAPLLARGGAARVSLPGGDIIGARPVDLHLAALESMGADIKVKHGVVYATAPAGLKPAKIHLRFPSVGATHQVLMAAALTPGTTELHGAAREPEIVAVANLLATMGASIEGAGTDNILIHGVSQLGGAKATVIGDRIEAGTYLLAACASGGSITANGIRPEYLSALIELLRDMGVQVTCEPDAIHVQAAAPLKAVQLATAPFPGFPTDLQAPLMAALSVARGESLIEENIFEGRYGHVSELCRMGAKISVEGRVARIQGIEKLSGAEVEGFDIRAAASLVVGAVAASGFTTIHEPQHLRRGYEHLENKLRGLGVRVSSKLADPEDYLFAGC